MMLARQPLLLTLAVERHFGPLERPVGVAERIGTVLFAFCRLDALGVADGACVLDLAADFLLIVFVQAAAVLDMIGECMKGVAVRFQQARDGTQRSKSFAPTVGGQQADRFAKLSGELARQCHGSSPPAPLPMRAHAAAPIFGTIKASRQQFTGACRLDDVDSAVGPQLRPL